MWISTGRELTVHNYRAIDELLVLDWIAFSHKDQFFEVQDRRIYGDVVVDLVLASEWPNDVASRGETSRGHCDQRRLQVSNSQVKKEM